MSKKAGRANELLHQWGWWSRVGIGGRGYPKKPTWQHLIGDNSKEPMDNEYIQACNKIVASYRPDKKVIITTYYSRLAHLVRKKDLPKATGIILKTEEGIKISSQAINAVIDDVVERVEKIVPET